MLGPRLQVALAVNVCFECYDFLFEIALGLPIPKYWDRIMDLYQVTGRDLEKNRRFLAARPTYFPLSLGIVQASLKSFVEQLKFSSKKPFTTKPQVPDLILPTFVE